MQYPPPPHPPWSYIQIAGFEQAPAHYCFLMDFLNNKDPFNKQVSQQRQNARDKLTRLNMQQFRELSTDLYDETTRREYNAQLPFLAVRDDMHPKRNQARQKLATLPLKRYKELAADMFFELEVRFPVLLETAQAEAERTGGGSMSPLPSHQQQDAKQLSSPIALLSESQKQSLNPSSSISSQSSLQQSKQQSSSMNYTGNTTANDISGSAIKSGSNKSSIHNLPTSPQQQSNQPYNNFGSLDALMADLGDLMIHDRPDSVALVEKLKGGYEKKISELNKRVIYLEGELADRENLAQYKTASEQLQTKFDAQQQILQRQELNLRVIREDYQKLQDEYSAQQTLVNEVRQEASELLKEIKSLSRQNEELRNQHDNDTRGLEKLMEQKTALELRLRSIPLPTPIPASAKTIPMSPASNSADSGVSPYPKNNSSPSIITDLPRHEHGGIEETRIVVYQTAIDGLIAASRSNVPTDVLMAMKSIVLSCKNITQDVEAYETTTPVSVPDRELLLSLKTQLQSSLTQLMAAAKNHATNANSGQINGQANTTLKNAAENLTRTIFDIGALVRIRYTRRQSNENSNDGRPENNKHSNNSNNNDKNAPSAYARQQQQEQYHQHDRPYSAKSPQSPIHHIQRLHSTTHADASKHMSIEVKDLKLFLESQTDLIVQAIQQLLQTMRQPSFGSEFRDSVDSITHIVDILVDACQSTFKESRSAALYREKGEEILEELITSNRRLAEYGQSLLLGETGDAKSSKQKLASASYEVAKFTKQLVNLLEP